jgi:hypothetical protein
MHPAEYLVPMSFFAATALVFWKFFSTRHKENMAMIERGISIAPQKPISNNPPRYLMWGILTLFVSIGLIISLILVQQFNVVEEITPALILLFAGIGLIANYGIASEHEKKMELRREEAARRAASANAAAPATEREYSSQP